MSTFEHIIVESKGAVGIITLNRPKMLNALSFGVFREIAARSTISKPTTRSAASS
jgi:enoyl-CoA hydratase